MNDGNLNDIRQLQPPKYPSEQLLNQPSSTHMHNIYGPLLLCRDYDIVK